jgi:hypothetical protein
MAMPAALARYHAARRATTAPVRRGPSPLVAKLKDKLASAQKRARKVASGNSGLMKDVAAFGGGAALAYGQKTGVVPARVGPQGMAVDTALVIAALGAFVLPRFIKGRMGAIAHDATLGIAGVAGYRMGSGEPVLGDDAEDDGLSGAGWEDVAS